MLAVGLLLAVAGCTNAGKEGDHTPRKITEGEAFSFNGWDVADGWAVSTKDTAINGEQIKSPMVELTVTNSGSETRPTLFQLVFVDGDQAMVTINCSTGDLAVDASEEVTCDGTGREYPTGYDSMQVQDITR